MSRVKDYYNFQTWICPICCDDHTVPVGDEVLCKREDLLEMRERLGKLSAALITASHRLEYVSRHLNDGYIVDETVRTLKEIGEKL